jgi:hypothetical protein
MPLMDLPYRIDAALLQSCCGEISATRFASRPWLS